MKSPSSPSNNKYAEATTLKYTLTTAPSPLKCSSAAANAAGTLTIEVTHPDTVYCDQILIDIPLGEAAAAVFLEAPRVVTKIQPAGWEQGETRFRPRKQPHGGVPVDMVIVVNNPDTTGKTKGTFKVIIDGMVAKAPGEATIQVSEFSGTGNIDNGEEKFHSFTVKKEENQVLYLRNFMSMSTKVHNQPCTEFTCTDSFQLIWETNATDIKLYQSGVNTPTSFKQNSNGTTIKNLTKETTFLLEATLGKDKLYGSLTVTISNPVLDYKEMEVAVEHKIQGKLEYNSAIQHFFKLLKCTSLEVKGSMRIGVKKSLHLPEVLAIPNWNKRTIVELISRRELALQKRQLRSGDKRDLLLSNSLESKGENFFNALRVNGNWSQNTGTISIFGTVYSHTFPHKRKTSRDISMEGCMRSRSDGIAILEITHPDGVWPREQVYGGIYVSGKWFCLRAGGMPYCMTGAPNSVLMYKSNSICIPVAANNAWQYCAYTSGNQVKISASFFITGGHYGKEESLEILPLQTDLPDPFPFLSTQDLHKEQQERTAGFVRSIEKAFDKKINKKTKHAFIRNFGR